MTNSRFSIRGESRASTGPAVRGAINVTTKGASSLGPLHIHGFDGSAIRTRPTARLHRPTLDPIPGVQIREPEVIQRAIDTISGLREMLMDSAQALRSAFGPHAAAIAIEPFFDPEVSGAAVRMFVIAITSLPSAEAEPILQGVISDWWVKHADRAQGRVTLDMEFV